MPVAPHMLSAIPMTAGTLQLIQLASGPAVIPAGHRFAGRVINLAIAEPTISRPARPHPHSHTSSAGARSLMNTPPTTYAIRVHGHLDDHWSAWLGELDMTHENDGTTTLTGSIADQAQLHGVLARLRDIGAVITELRTTDQPVPLRASVLQRPRHTERLTLRLATAEDAEST